jgi:anthranilate phosphoribosyltransferase
MGIKHYIKDIGRGKDGARALTREQAADLMGQVLDGAVTDLEVGAFCIAMRVKGETEEEMAGFLDATHQRLAKVPHTAGTAVVLPTYNGARKLPVLTPLLAMLLAQRGAAVLVHGTATEDTRITSEAVFSALQVPAARSTPTLRTGELAYVPTEVLCPGLKRLLDVRRTVGLRNPAHSLVKLMNPCEGPALVIGSYTHPEYATSMAATFELTHTHALLLRGTEGEPVAHEGPLTALPDLPKDTGAEGTAAYIRDVLIGKYPVPTPISRQVEHILQELQHHDSSTHAL